MGHFQEMIPQNESEEKLLELMNNYEINVGTTSFTMMGLQKGFSLCFSLLFLWSGVISLYLVSRAGMTTKALRHVSLINSIALFTGTIISLTYFFFAPTLCFALACIFFVVSYFRMN
jgi:hypothetical protein